MARCHEQPVASGAAEADVGAALGKGNEADWLPGSIENFDPVLLGITHTPAAPEIAVDIATEAIGRAAWLGRDEGASIVELVIVDVVDLYRPRGDARLDDVEFLLIRREGKPVRLIDIARRHSCAAGLGIEAVYVRGQLRSGDLALVVAEDSERRIGKPDRVVG